MAIVRPFVTYSDDYNENVLNKAISAGMQDDEKVLILALVGHLEQKKRKRPISEGTKRVLISKLCSIRKHTDDIPFTELTGKDLDKLFNALDAAYAANTLNVLKSVFIQFYRYLISKHPDKTKINLDDLAGIEKSEIPLALDKKDLLTAEDIEKMLAATRNQMHRALIATLAESGARVHEVCMLKWSDLVFDKQGIVLSVKSTKVNKIRTVRLRDAVPYISAWKAVYPHYSPSAHVFITQRGTTLIYELVRSTIARIAKDAGIEKKITPHVFRHTRVTELLRMGMHEPELKKSLWGSVSTKMLSRYEHLSGMDIDAEYKRLYGLEDGEKTKPMLPAPIQCQNCSTVNEKGRMFCGTCGLPLSEAAKSQLEQERAGIRAAGVQFIRADEMDKLVNEKVQAALKAAGFKV